MKKINVYIYLIVFEWIVYESQLFKTTGKMSRNGGILNPKTIFRSQKEVCVCV